MSQLLTFKKARSIDRLGTHPKGGDSASNNNNNLYVYPYTYVFTVCTKEAPSNLRK